MYADGGVLDSCREELTKHCASIQKPPDQVRCLLKHNESRSAACGEALDRERAEGSAFRQDCKTDIGGACLDLQGRALIECLESQGSALSKDCAARLAKMRAERVARHERLSVACKDAAVNHCPGVAAGGIAACLRTSEEKLSKECRESLK